MFRCLKRNKENNNKKTIDNKSVNRNQSVKRIYPQESCTRKTRDSMGQANSTVTGKSDDERKEEKGKEVNQNQAEDNIAFACAEPMKADPQKEKNCPEKKELPKKEEPPCPKKEEPLCPEKEDPPCPKEEEPPCPKKEEPPCAKKEEPPCPAKEEPPCPKKEEPPCLKKEEPPCPEKKEPPSPKKEEPPCPKKEEPLCPEKKEPLSPKKEEPPCPKKEEPPCPKKEAPPPSPENCSNNNCNEVPAFAAADAVEEPLTAEPPKEEISVAAPVPAASPTAALTEQETQDSCKRKLPVYDCRAPEYIRREEEIERQRKEDEKKRREEKCKEGRSDGPECRNFSQTFGNQELQRQMPHKERHHQRQQEEDMPNPAQHGGIKHHFGESNLYIKDS